MNCASVLHIPIVRAHDVSKQIPREIKISIGLKMFQSCSRLRLEQLLRIFRALQTSRVLRISMNARWRMNQLLNFKFLTFCIILPYINISSPLPPKNGKKKWNKYKNWQYRASLVFCEDTRFVESIFVCFVSPERYYFRGDRTKATNKSYTQIFLKFLFYFMIDKS